MLVHADKPAIAYPLMHKRVTCIELQEKLFVCLYDCMSLRVVIHQIRIFEVIVVDYELSCEGLKVPIEIIKNLLYLRSLMFKLEFKEKYM